MAYGLRKINKNGIHHDFKWSLEVGTVVECPDWSPEPKCGNGLHLLPNAQGNWNLLHGHYWVVVEYDPTDLVMIDGEKGKVPKCKIVEIQDPENFDSDKLLSYFDWSKFDSRNAYCWAFSIGNHDVMIDKITDPEWAYWWALYIGNRDVMIDRVTDPAWAYIWARAIGDEDVMKSRITDSFWIEEWNESFPDNQIVV